MRKIVLVTVLLVALSLLVLGCDTELGHYEGDGHGHSEDEFAEHDDDHEDEEEHVEESHDDVMMEK